MMLKERFIVSESLIGYQMVRWSVMDAASGISAIDVVKRKLIRLKSFLNDT